MEVANMGAGGDSGQMRRLRGGFWGVKLEVFSRETEVHLAFPHEKTKGECHFERENTMPNERRRGEKDASGPVWALGSSFGIVFYRVK